MSLNVLAIGASRNIGYFTAVRLLDAGARVTFLVRSPTAFDNDNAIQGYVKTDKAVLVRGDGLNIADVQRAWEEAVKGGTVDAVLFSVGGIPNFRLPSGYYITPANLVTECLLNTLCTMPEDLRGPTSQLRFVVVTSTGLTKTSLATIPFLLRFLYRAFLRQPHADKIGTERIVSHVSGWEWNDREAAEPGEDILGPDWKNRQGLPSSGSFQGFLVVRPFLLTDGNCLADKEEYKREGAKKPYRVSEEEIYAWWVSRKDVAHFIADAILTKWDNYKNKVANIGY